MIEVRIEGTFEGNNGFWGVDSFLLLDICGGYTNRLAFKKFINLYSRGLCIFFYVCYILIFKVTLKMMVPPLNKMPSNRFLMRWLFLQVLIWKSPQDTLRENNKKKNHIAW